MGLEEHHRARILNKFTCPPDATPWDKGWLIEGYESVCKGEKAQYAAAATEKASVGAGVVCTGKMYEGKRQLQKGVCRHADLKQRRKHNASLKL